MGFKHFSSHLLRHRLTTAYPWMMAFLPESSSDSSSSSMLRSRSEENLQKLSDCMENMDDDVSRLFIEYHQTDLREDLDLFALLNDFFTTSKEVSELCESLKKFLEKTEHDDCDFLAGDFIGKLQMCHDDLVNMVVKLETTMKEINKKLKRARGVRAIVAAAILVPVAALLTVSKIFAGSLPIETLLTGSLPMETISKFAALRWKKATAALKSELIAITSMERGTVVALNEIEKLGKLVRRLESVESSIRLKKRSSSSSLSMRGGMDMKRKKLKSTLVDLDKETKMCEGLTEFGRIKARDKIVEFLSGGAAAA